MPALWRDRPFYLLLLGTLLLVGLAYQIRLPAWVDVGSLGDRAYLWASPLQVNEGFNGDEHLVAEGISYRWTKARSQILFPDLAWRGPLRLRLRLRGWRPERQTLPEVEVLLNGAPLGRFQASGEWEVQAFEVDDYPRRSGDLEILIASPTFSVGEGDSRILGAQLDWLRLDPRPDGPALVLPPWSQLLLWTAAVSLVYAGLRRWWGERALWVAVGLALLVAAGLALGRHWLTPYARWVLVVVGFLFLLSRVDRFLALLRRAARRGRTLPFFATLVGAVTVVAIGYLRWAVQAVPHLGPRPDAVLLVVFVAAAAIYALITWDRPLRRLFSALDLRLRRPWLAGVLLVLLVAGLTLYEWGFIREARFVGHADYADNALVARNLLAGRGFTVDYVTQFFRPYPEISHPQETWPLLQPVLIAPSFYLLGDSAFAAKVPNLVLQLFLAVAIYFLGSRLFDRRVGLLAVALTLFNPFIFRLIIFPTSDLAFTLLALLTLGQFFRASEAERAGELRLGSYAWAGVWAGVMMLAKPNGALYVALCLLWDLFWRWRDRRWGRWWQAWLAFGFPAGLIFAPWVLRNWILFGSPVHSTEQVDAWILKYQEWEEIYRIYFDDVPERSWLLRYGFDRVFQAIGSEFRRWRNYFFRDANALLTLLGTALALGGLVSLWRRDRDPQPAGAQKGRLHDSAGRLFSLVGLVFFSFGTFICVYWHVEERYFVPFIPWLALLAARGLWWIHDRLAYRRGPQGQGRPSGLAWLGVLVVVLAGLHVTGPFLGEARAKLATDRLKRQEIAAYRWLAEQSEPDDVVMTRVPWQLSYYSERRSVMIPYGTPEDARQIAELYDVDYLFMDGDARGKRPALNQSLREEGPWRLVYDQGGVQIYRFAPEP